MSIRKAAANVKKSMPAKLMSGSQQPQHKQEQGYRADAILRKGKAHEMTSGQGRLGVAGRKAMSRTSDKYTTGLKFAGDTKSEFERMKGSQKKRPKTMKRGSASFSGKKVSPEQKNRRAFMRQRDGR